MLTPTIPHQTCVVLVTVATALGCHGKQLPKVTDAPNVPYASAAEVEGLLSNPGTALVEFCVPVGCFRCDGMRASINTLAERNSDRITTRRVNLNLERRLAAEWRIAVCPTYLVLENGKEVARLEYPTSADLIEASLPPGKPADPRS